MAFTSCALWEAFGDASAGTFFLLQTTGFCYERVRSISPMESGEHALY